MPAKPSVVAFGLPLELDTVRQENRTIIDRLISALETEPDLADRFYRVMYEAEERCQQAPTLLLAK